VRSFSRFAFAITACLPLCAAPAAAHPLGNFTINHLAKVTVRPSGVTVRYIVDMAEIPTFQVMAERDIRGPQRAQRLTAWARDETRLVLGGLTITADGTPLVLRPDPPGVRTRPGAGGLPTLYFVDVMRARLPAGGVPRHLRVVDANYTERVGWKDIVVFPNGEPTQELRAYPNALLGSPRSVTLVDATLASDGRAISVSAHSAALLAPAGSTSAVRSNVLSDMLSRGTGNIWIVLLTLAVATGLGALHALEPGHGKTLLAVSLVGARATTQQAVILASALTLAHTAGVIALGIALLAFAHTLVPESVYPWITLGSGALVAVLGATSLARVVKSRRGLAHSHSHDAPAWRGAHLGEPRPSHPENIPHDHLGCHEHGDHEHEARHKHDGNDGYEDGKHYHAGGMHAAAELTPLHASHHADAGLDVGAEAIAHARAHGIPAGTAPLSFRTVVLIAMSGNLAPCPAALVVLLTAMTLHQVGYGMLVVVAFSLGLAAVLTGLGIAVVRGAGWFSTRPSYVRLVRYGPLATAAMISIIGTVMIANAATNVVPVSAWLVGTFVALAIAGYALAPGHTHSHTLQPHPHGDVA
jgi:nickel/cobalt exporter